MVPSFLGEHASLAKDVVVVGVGDRMELWDKAAWSDHRPTLLSSVAEVTARVDDGCLRAIGQRAGEMRRRSWLAQAARPGDDGALAPAGAPRPARE